MLKKESKEKSMSMIKKFLLGIFILFLVTLSFFQLPKQEQKSQAMTKMTFSMLAEQISFMENNHSPIQSILKPFTLSNWPVGTPLHANIHTNAKRLGNINKKVIISNKEIFDEDHLSKNEDRENNQKKKEEAFTNKENELEEEKEQEKVVYLTFDDGPQSMTKNILFLLKKYDAKATFFMLEPNMRAYPHAVKQMVKEGHAVGMHGVTHDVKQVYQSPKTVVHEMRAGQKTLEKLTGVKTNLMRVPYGSSPYMKPSYLKALNEAGYIMWDWHIDSLDWKFRNQQYVHHTIKQQQTLSEDKKVVLMHEQPTTVAHLEKLLKYYKKNGFKMNKLTEDMKPIQFKKQ